MNIDQKNTPLRTKKISANAALGIGIAAGFAFLIGLGAALNILPGTFVLLAFFGLTLFASLSLLLSQK